MGDKSKVTNSYIRKNEPIELEINMNDRTCAYFVNGHLQRYGFRKLPDAIKLIV